MPRHPCALLVLAALLGGCAPSAVRWDGEDTRRATVAGDSADVALARLVADAAGAPPIEAPPADSLAAGARTGEVACAGSVRRATATAGEAIVWWSPRPDGRAQLRARHLAPDSGRAALAVDTVVARDSIGCARPAPAVALDAATGWLHVAYTMLAPEGPGVFYAHQMDRRAAFEPPRAIVYGAGRPATAVASDGDVVAVAFEDPNARPTVAVAVSRTGGHTFEPPVRASRSSVAATRPRVAVRGRRVAVGWIEPGAPGAPVALLVRTGRVE